MKKMVCLLLAFCLVFTQGIAFVLAADTNVTVNTRNVISAEQGVGYYDNGINGGTGNLELAPSDSICLRGGNEWAKYDLSSLDLEQGTYSVKALYCATVATSLRAHLDVLVDDVLYTKTELIQTTTKWENLVYVEADLGNVYVSSQSKTLSLKNSGAFSLYLQSFQLTFVSAENMYDNTVRFNGQNISNYPNITANAVEYRAGVDYFDALGYVFAHNNVSQNLSVVYHGTDWSRYDISDLKSGTYEVIVNSGNSAIVNLGFNVDGETKLGKAVVPATGGYDKFVDANVGKIYIPENAEMLKIKNVGTSSVYLRYFKLKFISNARTVFPETKMEAENVISLTDGDGFYHNTSESGSAGLEKSVGATGYVVCLRKSEWLKYSVAGMEAGTYRLSVNRANNSEIGFEATVDGALKVSGVKLGACAGPTYETYLTSELGTVYIPSGAQTIKIKNNSTSSRAAFVDYFTLTYVSDKNIATVKKQIEALNVVLKDGVITHGVSFYDAGGEQKWETNSSVYLVLRLNDWARYDVSDLEPGRYQIKAMVGNQRDTALGVSVGGVTQISPVPILATGDYLIQTLIDLGTVTIGEEPSIELVGGSVYAMYVAYLVLERIPLQIKTGYSSDANGNTAITHLSDVIPENGSGVVYASVDVLNNGYLDAMGFTVVIAVYEGDRLVSCNLLPQTLLNNTELKQAYPVTVNSGYTVKTFLWEDIGNLSAIYEVEDIS